MEGQTAGFAEYIHGQCWGARGLLVLEALPIDSRLETY